MSGSTLATLRIIIPGVIIFTIASLLASPVRKWFWQPSLNDLNNNLKDKMIAPFDVEFSDAEKRLLREDQTLLHMFYNIVDSDESLKEKSSSIRLNGLICTSIADMIILGFLGGYSFFCAYLALQRSHYVWLSISLYIVSLLGYVFALPEFSKKHKVLSDEQINALMVNYKSRLRKKFMEYLGKGKE
jgi:hypothetical protein